MYEGVMLRQQPLFYGQLQDKHERPQRLQRVGLWCLAWQALIAAVLGRALSGVADYDQRAASSCSGLRSLGPALGTHSRGVPV